VIDARPRLLAVMAADAVARHAAIDAAHVTRGAGSRVVRAGQRPGVVGEARGAPTRLAMTAIAAAQEDRAQMRRMRPTLSQRLEVAALTLWSRASEVALGRASMTAATAEHGVVAEQGEARGRVRFEATVGTPAAWRVAFGAGPGHAAHVSILVARAAGAHVVIAIPAVVTAGAGDLGVSALEGCAREAMIEAARQRHHGVEAVLCVATNAA